MLHKLGLNESSYSNRSSIVARNSSQPTNINKISYRASSPLGPAYYTSPPYVSPTATAPSYLPAQQLASPLVPPGFYYMAPSLPAQQPIGAQFISNGNTGMTSAPLAQTADASGQATSLPHSFTTGTLHDLGSWNMDTCASSHLNSSVTSLNIVFNTCMYSSISVVDGHSIPVTNTGHSVLPTQTKSLHLNNVLITPHIVNNLIFVRQFMRENNCTIEFNAFGFSVKDFLMRRVLLRCDSTGDFYPVTSPSPIPHAFLVSQHTWHQRLGHPRVKCCVVLFLLILFRIIKRSLSFRVMLVSLENTSGFRLLAPVL
nr:ribonuclease H-like domain-containing protein [Tanacetum cinerariifolium]